MYIFTTVSSRFAKPDAIIDLWEKYNVPNGADILLVSMAHIKHLKGRPDQTLQKTTQLTLPGNAII